MTVLDDLLRNYRIAFLRYVGRREEAALAAGYELGRTAVASGGQQTTEASAGP